MTNNYNASDKEYVDKGKRSSFFIKYVSLVPTNNILFTGCRNKKLKLILSQRL